MNNKQIGTEFEKEFCKLLNKAGYWVHFITPRQDGSQPFDIIAARFGFAYAFDCKTSVKKIFPISRLEDNQILAFDKWVRSQNHNAYIAVKRNDEIFIVPYLILRERKKVVLEDGNGVFCWK